MDPKLKALKVVDLRQILAAANVPVPAKATKSDLITKIQNSKPALDVYAKLHPPDDLLAPPEEVDWNVEQSEPVQDSPPQPTPPPKVASTKPPSAPAPPAKPAPVACTPVAAATPSASAQDSELERRKRRAERFGIPFVEPKETTAKKASGSTEQPEARASGRKRSAQKEDADTEELERRKKRAQRFGIPLKS